jgi:hypothetical protein
MKIALSNICLICNATVERFVREVEGAFIGPDGEIVPTTCSVYNGVRFHMFHRMSMCFQEFVYSSFS